MDRSLSELANHAAKDSLADNADELVALLESAAETELPIEGVVKGFRSVSEPKVNWFGVITVSANPAEPLFVVLAALLLVAAGAIGKRRCRAL